MREIIFCTVSKQTVRYLHNWHKPSRAYTRTFHVHRTPVKKSNKIAEEYNIYTLGLILKDIEERKKNVDTFNFGPPRIFYFPHCCKKVTSGHDYSLASRAPGELKNNQSG